MSSDTSASDWSDSSSAVSARSFDNSIAACATENSLTRADKSSDQASIEQDQESESDDDFQAQYASFEMEMASSSVLETQPSTWRLAKHGRSYSMGSSAILTLKKQTRVEQLATQEDCLQCDNRTSPRGVTDALQPAKSPGACRPKHQKSHSWTTSRLAGNLSPVPTH